MRLIDIDKALIEAEDECRMSDDWKVSHEMMNVFKYQPTVKAIPIEWIEQYINRFGWANKLTYMHKEHLKTLIKDWEKENETN